jgi:hypothetical protein
VKKYGTGWNDDGDCPKDMCYGYKPGSWQTCTSHTSTTDFRILTVTDALCRGIDNNLKYDNTLNRAINDTDVKKYGTGWNDDGDCPKDMCYGHKPGSWQTCTSHTSATDFRKLTP